MSSIGHPTPQQEVKTDETIRFYFERGLGIWECVNRSGISYRTVKSRYRRFSERLAKTFDSSFLKRQEKVKNQALLALDKQIAELSSIQQQVLQGVNVSQKLAETEQRPMTEREIKASQRSKLSWIISDITDKKCALEMTPTVAEKVRKEVQEYLNKLQKQNYTEQIQRAGQ